MTGYVCRYAPYEILQAFGEDVRFITLGSKNIYEEPACLHSNLCSFAKRVFGEMNCESFLSLNCCDSLRRAADAMEKQGVKVMRVTLPHIITPASVDFFAREIIALISEAERFFGRPFDEEKFLSLLENEEKEENAELEAQWNNTAEAKRGININPGKTDSERNFSWYMSADAASCAVEISERGYVRCSKFYRRSCYYISGR